MPEYNFKTLYQTWTTDKLLDVVDNPGEYQPLAVETARLELDKRQLSAEQLESAKTIQAERKNHNTDKEKKAKEVEEKLKSVGASLGDILDPIQTESPTADKLIKLISLFLGGLFLYNLYNDFGMVTFMLTSTDAEWDFSMVLYFLPLLILPSASLLMWRKKKAGWILATLFFSYTATGAIPLFITALNTQSAGLGALDTLFPSVPPSVYIGTFLLFGSMTWVMTKRDLRAVFNIDRRMMFLTIGFGAAGILLVMIGI